MNIFADTFEILRFRAIYFSRRGKSWRLIRTINIIKVKIDVDAYTRAGTRLTRHSELPSQSLFTQRRRKKTASPAPDQISNSLEWFITILRAKKTKKTKRRRRKWRGRSKFRNHRNSLRTKVRREIWKLREHNIEIEREFFPLLLLFISRGDYFSLPVSPFIPLKNRNETRIHTDTYCILFLPFPVSLVSLIPHHFPFHFRSIFSPHQPPSSSPSTPHFFPLPLRLLILLHRPLLYGSPLSLRPSDEIKQNGRKKQTIHLKRLERLRIFVLLLPFSFLSEKIFPRKKRSSRNRFGRRFSSYISRLNKRIAKHERRE